MAEWNRLRLADAGIGHKGRALHDVNDSAQCRNDEYCAKNGGAGQRIRAAMKDLRHSLMRSSEETRRSFVVQLIRSVRQFKFRVRKPPTGFRVGCETENYKYFE